MAPAVPGVGEITSSGEGRRRPLSRVLGDVNEGLIPDDFQSVFNRPFDNDHAVVVLSALVSGFPFEDASAFDEAMDEIAARSTTFDSSVYVRTLNQVRTGGVTQKDVVLFFEDLRGRLGDVNLASELLGVMSVPLEDASIDRKRKFLSPANSIATDSSKTRGPDAQIRVKGRGASNTERMLASINLSRFVEIMSNSDITEEDAAKHLGALNLDLIVVSRTGEIVDNANAAAFVALLCTPSMRPSDRIEVVGKLAIRADMTAIEKSDTAARIIALDNIDEPSQRAAMDALVAVATAAREPKVDAACFSVLMSYADWARHGALTAHVASFLGTDFLPRDAQLKILSFATNALPDPPTQGAERKIAKDVRTALALAKERLG